jgi:hypothetical protein
VRAGEKQPSTPSRTASISRTQSCAAEIASQAKKSSQGASRRIVLNPVCLDIVGPVLCIVRWFGTLQRGRGPLAVPQISHPPCVVAVSPVFGNANESCDKVMHVSPRQNSSRAGVSKRRSGWKMTGIQ